MTDGLIFIAPVYAGFFGIMLVLLSWRIVRLRHKYGSFNHKMNEGGHNEMTAAVRAQGNFIEYLPLALLLMWMLETMQFSAWIIHALGVLLILARLLHVHGLNEPGGNGAGRKRGTRLTWTQIVACSLLAFAGAFGVVF